MSVYPSQERLVDGMLATEVIKFGGSFELKAGGESSFYVNARDMLSEPELFIDAAYAIGNLADSLFFNENALAAIHHDRFLMAIPEAFNEYAGAAAYQFALPLLKRRVSLKTHGEPRPIEGKYHRGDDVVLVDDVVSSKAESKVESIGFLEENGISTAGVVVLVDRQQGGRTELAKRGINFASVLRIKSIGEYALKKGRISQDTFDTILGELDPSEL
jgi:uridine monophosphate synthetase